MLISWLLLDIFSGVWMLCESDIFISQMKIQLNKIVFVAKKGCIFTSLYIINVTQYLTLLFIVKMQY